MTPVSNRGWLALVLAALLALSACGGSDESAESAVDTADEASASASETDASGSASESDEEEVATETEETTTEDAATQTEEGQTEEGQAEEAADHVAETPSDIEVDTYYGDPVTVPYDPPTMVVLDYAALDTIDYLGLGDRVLGIPSATSVPPHLAAYADVENIGSLFEPDFEAINALQPDLIVAGGRSQATIGELAEIAPTIDMTFNWGSEPFVESLVQNTMALASIFGLDAEAAGTLEAINAAATDVATQAADDGTGLVLLTTGGEVSAYGPDPEGRFDLVYNILGIHPALEQVAIDTHGDAISFEFLAETNADILIVLDRDAAIGAEGESAQAILDNELVNGTSAAQNGNIVYVDTAKWYLSFGGLSSVQTMIAEVDSVVD